MDLPIRPQCPPAVLIPGCVLGGLSVVAVAVGGRLQAGDVFVFVEVKSDQSLSSDSFVGLIFALARFLRG